MSRQLASWMSTEISQPFGLDLHQDSIVGYNTTAQTKLPRNLTRPSSYTLNKAPSIMSAETAC